MPNQTPPPPISNHRPLLPAFRLPPSAYWSLVPAIVGIVVLSGMLLPIAFAQAQFAHPAFQATWARSDGLVSSGAVKRPWVWGPAPGQSATEPFAGLPGNAHLVQYFDKGRMEVNNPSGNQNDPFFVTNGLLSVELISGRMQVG